MKTSNDLFASYQRSIYKFYSNIIKSYSYFITSLDEETLADPSKPPAPHPKKHSILPIRFQILEPMAPSPKGDDPPSYREIKENYSKPSSLGICIHSTQPMSSSQQQSQQQPHNTSDNDTIDKGKKPFNVD